MCIALWSDLYGAIQRSSLSCQLIVLTTKGGVLQSRKDGQPLFWNKLFGNGAFENTY